MGEAIYSIVLLVGGFFVLLVGGFFAYESGMEPLGIFLLVLSGQMANRYWDTIGARRE